MGALDTDNGGTLDAKELRGKIAKTHMKLADPDNNGPVSKDAYQSFVEQLFRDVDPDRHATIDAKEMKTKKGKALLGLTR